MKQYYIPVQATLLRESSTGLSVQCSFLWEEEFLQFDEKYVPFSVIDESCHDEIHDSGEGDVVELFIAKWWLMKNS